MQASVKGLPLWQSCIDTRQEALLAQIRFCNQRNASRAAALSLDNFYLICWM
jgi:hypothetical protein